jgi:hypothetical protein
MRGSVNEGGDDTVKNGQRAALGHGIRQRASGMLAL